MRPIIVPYADMLGPVLWMPAHAMEFKIQENLWRGYRLLCAIWTYLPWQWWIQRLPCESFQLGAAFLMKWSRLQDDNGSVFQKGKEFIHSERIFALSQRFIKQIFHSQHRQCRHLMSLNLQGLTTVEQSSCMNNQLSYRTSQNKKKMKKFATLWSWSYCNALHKCIDDQQYGARR